jgi:ankyrin repeat protein
MAGVTRRRRKKLQGRLLVAAAWGSQRWVAVLLQAGADPNPPGSTPLYLASVQDRPGNVRVLLAAGADPHAESAADDEGLPLCAAACSGHAAVVRELLEAGADPLLHEDGGVGHSAVEWASAGGHRQVLDLLHAAQNSSGRSS